MSKRPTELRDWSNASEVLFRSAREDHAPTAGDRERVRNALAQRLGDVSNAPIVGAGADSLLSAARPSSLALSTLVKVGLGLGVVMAGVLVFLRAGDSPKATESKPVAPASVEGARVAERVATLPATPPAAHSNDVPVAMAAENNGSANAVRRSRDRGSVEIGSARPRPGAKANDARALDRVVARDNAAPVPPAQTSGSTAQVSSPAIGTSDVGASAPARTDNSSAARTPARTDNSSAARTPARTDNSSAARTPARTDSSSAARTAAQVENRAEDRVASSPDDDSASKHAAAPTALDAPANAELDPSDPRAELFFVRRIQAALRDEEPRTVLSLCAEHERRWPHGTFAQEREALRAIASCQADVRDAAARASKFFAVYPRGPLAPRVREACALRLKAASVESRTPAFGEVDRQ